MQDRSGHRFWDDFSSIFGPRIRWKSVPRGVRTRSEKECKKVLRLEGFGVDFASILGPNLDPGGVRERRFGRFLQSWGGLGGKMAARCPKSASKTDFGPILIDFWLIFDEFLMLLPLFLLALKRELGIEVGLLFRCRGYWCVLPSCVISLTIHSQNPFIEARWRRWPEGQLDIIYNI